MVAAFLRGMLSGELVWRGAGRAAGRGYGWLVVAGCVVIAAAGGYRESETEIVGDGGEIAVNGPRVPGSCRWCVVVRDLHQRRRLSPSMSWLRWDAVSVFCGEFRV